MTKIAEDVGPIRSQGEPGLTVREYSTLWLERMPDKAEPTRRRNHRMVELLIQHLGDMELRRVEPHHIQRLLSLAPDARAAYTTWDRVFYSALHEDVVYRNPVAYVRRPDGTRAPRRKRP